MPMMTALRSARPAASRWGSSSMRMERRAMPASSADSSTVAPLPRRHSAVIKEGEHRENAEVATVLSSQKKR